MKSEHWRTIAFAAFAACYVIILIINILRGSSWSADAFIGICVLVFLYLSKDYIRLNALDIVAVNLLLLMHNAGVFGAYSLHIGSVAYDTFLHAFASFAGAFIVGSILARLNLFGSVEQSKKTTLKIFTIAAIVLSIGVLIEMTEFLGSIVFKELQQTEGLLTPGGDAIEKFGPVNGYYLDTMKDIITDLVFAILGAFAYSFMHRADHNRRSSTDIGKKHARKK